MAEKVPVDYDDFVRRYRGIFLQAGISDREVERVAYTLWVDKGLKDFRESKPKTVTCEETLAYLGVPYTTWRSFVVGCRDGSRRHSNFAPSVVEGGTMCRGPYLYTDIERIFKHRPLCFPKYDESDGGLKKFAASVVPQTKYTFRTYLEKTLEEYLQDPRDLLFEIPDHLPQNDNEIYHMYDKMVANVVYKRIKYGIHPEDARSEVWTKLLNSDLINKFVQSGTERLPVTMTGNEAKDFLGVTDKVWDRMMRTYTDAPTPVKGDYRDPLTRYKTTDIVKLDKTNYFRRRPLPRRLPPDSVSKQRLDGYIKLAATRAILNIFRHLARHNNPEVLQQEGVTLVLGSSGTYQAKKNYLEDAPAWEDSFPSDLPQQDEACDAYRLATALGVDYGSPEYFSAIRSVVERAERRGIKFKDFPPEICLSMVTSLIEGTSLAGDAQFALVEFRQKQRQAQRLVCQQA